MRQRGRNGVGYLIIYIVPPQYLFNYHLTISFHNSIDGQVDSSSMTMSSQISVNQLLLLLALVFTLVNLAKTIHDSSRVYLLQQSLCFNYYTHIDPSKIDHQSRIEESLCKHREIQAPLSVADGIDSFLRHLPGESPKICISSSIFSICPG